MPVLEDGSEFKGELIGFGSVIRSVKIGVGGNSSVGSDMTENDSENALDTMEARDPRKGLIGGDELVLLVPSVCRRRLIMHAISRASMGLGS